MKWNGEEYANWNDSVNESNKKDSEHPSPEQMLLKMALEQLSKKRQRLWDMYAYEGLTQEQIAAELGISQQAVQKQLDVIENKIKSFVTRNKGTYLLLKMEYKIDYGEGNEMSSNYSELKTQIDRMGNEDAE